jgi:hypothetical protein
MVDTIWVLSITIKPECDRVLCMLQWIYVHIRVYCCRQRFWSVTENVTHKKVWDVATYSRNWYGSVSITTVCHESNTRNSTCGTSPVMSRMATALFEVSYLILAAGPFTCERMHRETYSLKRFTVDIIRRGDLASRFCVFVSWWILALKWSGC